MKLTFKDITSNEIYEASKVLFVVGPYNTFNNIAIDEIRDRCKPKKQKEIASELLADFDIKYEDADEITVSNSLDIETFMKVVNIASMNGKWFTSIDYAFMTKKQKDWLNSYIENTSDNGKLVVYCNEYKDYKSLLRNRVVLNSPVVNIIQLSFPYRDVLESVVRTLFEQRGVKIEASAIELFTMRMSSSYDEYSEVIDKIITDSAQSIDTLKGNVAKDWKYTITYDDTLRAMKGIENFVLDDFIDKILNPLGSDKSNGRNKVYRMLASLTEEIGAAKLVAKLRYKIDDYIELRLAINSGYIPIMVRFSVQEAKNRISNSKLDMKNSVDSLEEQDKNNSNNKQFIRDITKISDYTFRKMAVIASRTSLKDWVYMKMLLSNTRYKYEDTSYEKVLYSLINRSVLNESRINNDIGIENVLNLSLDTVDSVKFTDEHLLFNK